MSMTSIKQSTFYAIMFASASAAKGFNRFNKPVNGQIMHYTVIIGRGGPCGGHVWLLIEDQLPHTSSEISAYFMSCWRHLVYRTVCVGVTSRSFRFHLERAVTLTLIKNFARRYDLVYSMFRDLQSSWARRHRQVKLVAPYILHTYVSHFFKSYNQSI